MTKKTILVTGGTGAQGSSVAHHLLHDGTFKVRVLTRNTESEKAKHLHQKGAEIVKGDFSDYESLLKALNGCEAAFLVTNFW